MIHKADTTDGKVHRIRESPSNPRKSIESEKVHYFILAPLPVSFGRDSKSRWSLLSGAKTIKKNTNSTQNKSETHRAKQYEVTSFLSTDCELSTETCSKNVYSLGPLVSPTRGSKRSHTGGKCVTCRGLYSTHTIGSSRDPSTRPLDW